MAATASSILPSTISLKASSLKALASLSVKKINYYSSIDYLTFPNKFSSWSSASSSMASLASCKNPNYLSMASSDKA